MDKNLPMGPRTAELSYWSARCPAAAKNGPRYGWCHRGRLNGTNPPRTPRSLPSRPHPNELRVGLSQGRDWDVKDKNLLSNGRGLQRSSPRRVERKGGIARYVCVRVRYGWCHRSHCTMAALRLNLEALRGACRHGNKAPSNEPRVAGRERARARGEGQEPLDSLVDLPTGRRAGRATPTASSRSLVRM